MDQYPVLVLFFDSFCTKLELSKARIQEMDFPQGVVPGIFRGGRLSWLNREIGEFQEGSVREALDVLSSLKTIDANSTVIQLLPVFESAEVPQHDLDVLKDFYSSTQPTERWINGLIWANSDDNALIRAKELDQITVNDWPLFKNLFLIDEYDSNDLHVNYQDHDRFELIRLVADVLRSKQQWVGRIFGIGASELRLSGRQFKRSLWRRFLRKIGKDQEFFALSDGTPTLLIHSIESPSINALLPDIEHTHVPPLSSSDWAEQPLEDLRKDCVVRARREAEALGNSFKRDANNWLENLFTKHEVPVTHLKSVLGLLVGEVPIDFGGNYDVVSLGFRGLVYQLTDGQQAHQEGYVRSDRFTRLRRELLRLESAIAQAESNNDWVEWMRGQIQAEPNGFRVGDKHFNDSGYIPEPPDFHVASFSRSTDAPLPNAVDLRAMFPPAKDQGRIGACTAYAIIAALEYHAAKSGHATLDLSEFFVYYEARAISGKKELGEGSNYANAIDALKKFGICRQESWPNAPSEVDVKPTQEAYEEASQHRLTIAKRVERDLNSIRGALAEGFPVLIAVKTSIHIREKASLHDGYIPFPKPDEVHQGSGHAMLIVGYDAAQRIFIVRNSWGEDWGDGGYCYMDEKYILDETLCYSRYILCEVIDWGAGEYIADRQQNAELEFDVRERMSQQLTENFKVQLQALKGEFKEAHDQWNQQLEQLRHGGFETSFAERQHARDDEFAQNRARPASDVERLNHRIAHRFRHWTLWLAAAVLGAGIAASYYDSRWIWVGIAVALACGALIANQGAVRNWRIKRRAAMEQGEGAYMRWLQESARDAMRTRFTEGAIEFLLKRQDELRLVYHDMTAVLNQFKDLLEAQIAEEEKEDHAESQFIKSILDERAAAQWWKHKVQSIDYSSLQIFHEGWTAQAMASDFATFEKGNEDEWYQRAQAALNRIQNSAEWKDLGEQEFNILELFLHFNEDNRFEQMGIHDQQDFLQHLIKKSEPLIQDIWRSFPRSKDIYIFRPTFRLDNDVPEVDVFLQRLFPQIERPVIDAGHVEGGRVIAFQMTRVNEA